MAFAPSHFYCRMSIGRCHKEMSFAHQLKKKKLQNVMYGCSGAAITIANLSPPTVPACLLQETATGTERSRMVD